MSDTISKSALLEWTEICKSDAASSASDYDMGMLRAFQMIEEQIQSGRFDTEGWISVKDRLPESGNEYLFIDTRGEKQVLYYNQETFLPWFDSVTHWMPLPKPPKGEDNE